LKEEIISKQPGVPRIVFCEQNSAQKKNIGLYWSARPAWKPKTKKKNDQMNLNTRGTRGDPGRAQVLAWGKNEKTQWGHLERERGNHWQRLLGRGDKVPAKGPCGQKTKRR